MIKKHEKINTRGGYSNSAHLTCLFVVLLMCVTLFCGALFVSFHRGIQTEAYSGTSVIGNLYNNSSDSFEYDNLNSLAIAAGFSSFLEMKEQAEQGTIKTSANFGNKTVKFGSYTTKQGAVAELIWIPVYLSKSNDGDAILTFWLANTEAANTSSYQEISTFSDGTMCYGSSSYAGSCSYTENGKTYTVQSDTYDSSYLRHVMLLGDYNYAENFGYRYSGGHRAYSHTA